jgi:hypothetical protein
MVLFFLIQTFNQILLKRFFYKACYFNETSTALSLIKENVNVNAQDQSNQVALANGIFIIISFQIA